MSPLSSTIVFNIDNKCFLSSKSAYYNDFWRIMWQVFGDEVLAQGLYLKSHQRCSAGIRISLSADQSSSSTLTESSFIADPCLIHRDTVMLE